MCVFQQLLAHAQKPGASADIQGEHGSIRSGDARAKRPFERRTAERKRDNDTHHHEPSMDPEPLEDARELRLPEWTSSSV